MNGVSWANIVYLFNILTVIGHWQCNQQTIYFFIYDRIWENPPYGIRARFAQSAFLVAQVEICQSPDFVIYMSNNPSSNCCRLLQRLVVPYEGEISLHFDPPSRHSRRTRSPLLWAVIRILYLETARFIDLLYVRSPFGHLRTITCRYQQRISTLVRSLRSFRTAPPRSI